MRWNAKINLTSLSDPDAAIDRLFLEPLVASTYLPAGTQSILDVGSGGGSPAIPLKLSRPEVRLWMVESKTRKAAFLGEAVRHLSLTGVSVETARYEELLTRPDLHESMDVVTMRAVRLDLRAMRSLQAFLRPGGRLFWFDSLPRERSAELSLPPLQIEAIHPLIDELSSRLVIMRKTL